MKANYRTALAGIWILALSMISCKNDEEGKYHFDNKVFISAEAFTSDIRIKRDNLDLTTEEQTLIRVGMAQPRERDIQIVLAQAPQLLNFYRAFYDDPEAQLLPEDKNFYESANLTAHIAAGQVLSSPVAFAFKNLDKLPIENGERYVLPMTILSADGMEVLESARNVYFVLTKASLVNVVADINNNSLWPSWTDQTEEVKQMEHFTLEALVYPNEFKNQISTIMGIEDTFLLRLGDANINPNQVQVAYGQKPEDAEATQNDRNNFPSGTDAKFEIKAGRWTHIAVTFNQGLISVFIDGKLKGSQQAVTAGERPMKKVNFAVNHSNEEKGQPRCFWIGHSYRLESDGDLYHERCFNGRIAEVRVWNRALTSEEINASNHFYKVDPRAEGLVSYWKFDDKIQGKTVRDYTENGYDLTARSDINWKGVALPE